jgi:hypothetical protein
MVMYSLRFSALRDILLQRCKQIAEEKTVESNMMMVSLIIEAITRCHSLLRNN